MMARAAWKTTTLKKGDYIFKMMKDDGYMMVEHCDRTIDPYLTTAENYATGAADTGFYPSLASARKACERIST